jgi:hypothetical protein
MNGSLSPSGVLFRFLRKLAVGLFLVVSSSLFSLVPVEDACCAADEEEEEGDGRTWAVEESSMFLLAVIKTASSTVTIGQNFLEDN